jgi:hypothetical protein
VASCQYWAGKEKRFEIGFVRPSGVTMSVTDPDLIPPVLQLLPEDVPDSCFGERAQFQNRIRPASRSLQLRLIDAATLTLATKPVGGGLCMVSTLLVHGLH